MHWGAAQGLRARPTAPAEQTPNRTMGLSKTKTKQQKGPTGQSSRAGRKSTKPCGACECGGIGQSVPASGQTPRRMLFNRRSTLVEVGLNKHGAQRAGETWRADHAPHALQYMHPR